jgi:hypothetical protein
MSHERLNQANSSRLCFCSVNDARNFAEQSVKHSRDWLAFHDLDFSKRYMEGDLDIVLRLATTFEPGDDHLIFHVIPPTADETRPDHGPTADVSGIRSRGDRNDYSVFGGLTKLIQGPQQVVHSSVRFETGKERLDVIGEIFARTAYATIDVGSSSAKRKMDSVPTSGDTGNIGDRERSHIQRGPEILKRGDGVFREGIGQRFNQSDFVDIVNALWVRFDNAGIWFSLKERQGRVFEVRDAFFSPANPCP